MALAYTIAVIPEWNDIKIEWNNIKIKEYEGTSNKIPTEGETKVSSTPALPKNSSKVSAALNTSHPILPNRSLTCP
jgi:hypothetical protein